MAKHLHNTINTPRRGQYVYLNFGTTFMSIALRLTIIRQTSIVSSSIELPQLPLVLLPLIGIIFGVKAMLHTWLWYDKGWKIDLTWVVFCCCCCSTDREVQLNSIWCWQNSMMIDGIPSPSISLNCNVKLPIFITPKYLLPRSFKRTQKSVRSERGVLRMHY